MSPYFLSCCWCSFHWLTISDNYKDISMVRTIAVFLYIPVPQVNVVPSFLERKQMPKFKTYPNEELDTYFCNGHLGWCFSSFFLLIIYSEDSDNSDLIGIEDLPQFRYNYFPPSPGQARNAEPKNEQEVLISYTSSWFMIYTRNHYDIFTKEDTFHHHFGGAREMCQNCHFDKHKWFIACLK